MDNKIKELEKKNKGLRQLIDYINDSDFDFDTQVFNNIDWTESEKERINEETKDMGYMERVYYIAENYLN